MSGGRLAPLRLAHVEQRPEVIVVVAPDEPAPGSEALIVQPALAGGAQMGTPSRAGCRTVVRASLPGIGGRYLVQVARSAAAGGWAAEELAALVVELERRCSYLLLASTVAPVVSSGPRRSGVQGPRRAVAWDGGGWSGARTRDLAASARTVSGRGYLCAAAASGSAPPRAVASTLADLTASGVPVGRITHGVAAALGASWAVELLGTPPLSAAQLQRLREQFGAAPRCDWCGLLVVGRHCRRCSPAQSRHRRRSVVFAMPFLALALVALYGFGGSGRPSPQPMQRVVSMRRPVAPGQRIAPADLATGAAPITWANPHQLADPGVAVGQLAAVPLPAGAPLMDSELAASSAGQDGRDVSLRLDDAAGLPLDPPDGLTADLYLVQPGRAPRVQLVLADALVIASRTVDGAAVATLRVRARDVPVLIQAESAGSLRLVGRSGA